MNDDDRCRENAQYGRKSRATSRWDEDKMVRPFAGSSAGSRRAGPSDRLSSADT